MMILEPIWVEDHKLRIFSLAFSTNGTLLASGDESGGIKIWDTTTGKLVRILHQQEPSSRVYSLAFSPDDLTLAAGDDFSIQLWEIATGNRISSFESVWHDGKGSPPVVSLAWRPDGKIIAYGSDTPKLLDVQSGIILKEFIGHEDYIIALAWNQAGTLLASGGAEEDSTIRLWNPDDGTQQAVLQGSFLNFVDMVFNSEGLLLYTGVGDIFQWDPHSKHSSRLFQAKSSRLNPLLLGAINPNRKLHAYTVAHGEGPGAWDYYTTVHIVNYETGNELALGVVCTEDVWSLKFRPDGKALAAGREDGKLFLWNLD